MTKSMILEHWERHTLNGDHLFHQRNFDEALAEFERALELIDNRFGHCEAGTPDEFRCFVVACHNAAHAAQEDGQMQLTEYYYRYGHRRLENLVREHQGRHRHQDALVREMECAQRRYLRFLEEHKRPVQLQREFSDSWRSRLKKTLAPLTRPHGNGRLSYLFY